MIISSQGKFPNRKIETIDNLETLRDSKESFIDKDLGSPEYDLIGKIDLSIIYEKIYDNLGESISCLKKLSDNLKDLRILVKLITIQTRYLDNIEWFYSKHFAQNLSYLKDHPLYNRGSNTASHEKYSFEYILTKVCSCGHEKHNHYVDFFDGTSKCELTKCPCNRFLL